MSRDIEAGRAFVRLLVHDKEFNKQLNAALSRVDGFSKSLKSVGNTMALVGAALTAPFAAAAKIFTDVGSELHDMSQRTGMSVQSLSELKFAAEQSGASLRDIGMAAREMQKRGLDPNTFDQVAARIAAIEDPTKRAQAAFEVFGKRVGSTLLPMLGDLDALRQRARDLGLTMDPKTAAAAEKFGDAINEAKFAVTNLAVEVGAALAPALTSLAQSLAESTASIAKWVGENNKLVVTLSLMGPALMSLGMVVSGVGDTIRGATAAAVGFKTALNFLKMHPYIRAAAVLTTIVAGLAYKFGLLGDKAESAAGGMDTLTDSTKKQAEAITEVAEAIDLRTAALRRMDEQKKKQGEVAEDKATDAEIRRINEENAFLKWRYDRQSRGIGPPLGSRPTYEERQQFRRETNPARSQLPFGGGRGQFIIQLLDDLSPRGRGKRGFASPDQVTDDIARNFGPSGTFSGRYAPQIFGTTDSKLQQLIEEARDQNKQLENIDRNLIRLQNAGPAHMIGRA